MRSPLVAWVEALRDLEEKPTKVFSQLTEPYPTVSEAVERGVFPLRLPLLMGELPEEEREQLREVLQKAEAEELLTVSLV